MRYDVVQGDLEPPLEIDLTDDVIGASSLTFAMARVHGTERITGPAIQTAPRKLHYVWQVGDTLVPGVYRGQVTAVYPGALPETFPSDEPLFIVIHPKV